MKCVYLFDEYKEKDIWDKFGRKGTYLSEITNLGLNVPNGFVITTDACNEYYENNRKINQEITKQINEYIHKLEQLTRKEFGNNENPLLISVMCSSKNEIPNTMDTILNVGLTEEIVENLSKDTNDFIWIWKCYFDFIKDYAKNIMGVDLETYEYIKNILNDEKTALTIEELRILLAKLKKEYQLKTKIEFPDNSGEQLDSIINACFKSWSSERANIYRRDMDIPFNEGLAVCIQSMIFGNINKNCKIGTIYTRDPFTGKKLFTDENTENTSYDFVYQFDKNLDEKTLLSELFPDIYIELKNISILLEKYYRDMIKINYVIQNNKLFITSVCKGKRSAEAALNIACDFAEEDEKIKQEGQSKKISK